MNSEDSRYASSLPPSYDSVVNDNRYAYHSNQCSGLCEGHIRNFNKLVKRYEISPIFAERLHKLRDFEIVFICDDSGSMKAPLHDVTNSYGIQRTRWDELKQLVSIGVDSAFIFDPDGVDIYFLNRVPMLHVKNSSELESVFAMEPRATDGAPTDSYGRPDISTLERVLTNECQPIDRIQVTIIAYTDNDNCLEYLDDWDQKIPNLDVVKDYLNEKKEIQQFQGKDFQFGFGDYMVKILVGGIDSWLHDLDEKKVTINNQPRSSTTTYSPVSDGAGNANYANM
ncbi:unnamed protein product [Adineta steineri]|uniref:VWFA domain-containing protein n=1 Tax=Adineta steineri TaxID=433720 RepID=A0A819WLC6_9BILA|nr:unnamed protein product [Adineta steineri]CAF4125446.1 unnamed protein product [Adineta steineri]